MSYHHLTTDERCHIHELHVEKATITEIARALGRDKSTISRELRRNRGQRGYRPRQAQVLAEARQLKCRNGRRVAPETWPLVEERLRQDWSPEHISGRFRDDGSGRVSHESIYQWIRQDKALGGDLHTHLRCRKQRRKRYGSGSSRRGRIPNRIGIEQRPEIVDKRTRVGDWEGDTIIGKGHRHAIVSLVERKTRTTLLYKVDSRRADEVTGALISRLREASATVKTITFDNGTEFSGHEAVAAELGAKVYFATPYHSWERGLNEQTNGLVRQYFPKGSSFASLTQADMRRVEDRLNKRPRKVLDYQTPEEVLQRSVTGRAVALRP